MIVSAANDDQMRNNALSIGVGCVLEKPVSYSTLHDHLLQLLVDSLPAARPTLVAAPRDWLAEWRLSSRQQGARILLAEDNPVNQEVGTELLRAAGLRADIAETGREAVDKARTGLYDLVLMDMQMPEMDGLQASRLIRAMPELADLPIIAMTANAFGEDREACLQAGMNDHVGKPVVPAVLFETLARWLPAISRARLAADAEADGSMPPAAAWLAVEGIDSERGLSFFGGNRNAYRSALGKFVQLYGEGLPAAMAWLVEPDDAALHAALRRELHSLGGASLAVGATALSQEVASLETALRGPAATDACDGLRRTADTLDRLTTLLSGWLSRTKNNPLSSSG